MIKFTILTAFFFGISLCDDFVQTPVYKYRYETEDVMKTAASNIPVRGYHVVEGGYYPSEIGVGGIGGGGGFGGAGAGNLGVGGGYFTGGQGGQYVLGNVAPITFSGAVPVGGYVGGGVGGHGIINGIGYPGAGLGVGGPGLIGGAGIAGAGLGGAGIAGAGIGGAGIALGLGHHVQGGEAIEKGAFSEGKKKVNDEHFEKKEGKKGEEVNQGESGFSKGEIAAKDVKGDSGHYSEVDGQKKAYQDGKEYSGGQHYNKEGQAGEEKIIKQGHKKGHKIKSFKNSHHKDETGKTEEYYDESHDEGGNYAFNGESGSFGEKGAASFKGGNEENKYNAGEAKKEGHFNSEQLVDKANANQGKYGENKYVGNHAIFGNKNGADEQSLLGHQESSKFYKLHPFIVPFHH